MRPDLVDVWIFRFRRGDTGEPAGPRKLELEILVMRRSPGRILPGLWQCVSGSLEAGESVTDGALRELREETGYGPEHIRGFYDLDQVNQFHEPSVRAIVTSAIFAVRVGPAVEPTLSHEHDAMRWVAPDVALELAVWPAYRDNPSGPGGPGASATLGADGIPNQIDGERVYRVGETVESQKQGGYLLGGYVFRETANCPADATPLVACFGLGPTAGSDVATGGVDVSVAIDVSDPNPPALDGWIGAPIVASMKGCTWDNGTPCPPVVMSIVWPTVPTEIAGERVYRATNQVSFPTSGSFLLGGRFTKPDFVPPCPAPINLSAAEQQLMPWCFVQTIDLLPISPMSSIDQPKNEIVVARVHVNDPLAAQCPAAAQADCKAAIVVESVVWRSDELITGLPPMGTASPSSGASAGTSATLFGPSTGTGTGQLSPNPSASALMSPPPPISLPSNNS